MTVALLGVTPAVLLFFLTARRPFQSRQFWTGAALALTAWWPLVLVGGYLMWDDAVYHLCRPTRA